MLIIYKLILYVSFKIVTNWCSAQTLKLWFMNEMMFWWNEWSEQKWIRISWNCTWFMNISLKKWMIHCLAWILECLQPFITKWILDLSSKDFKRQKKQVRFLSVLPSYYPIWIMDWIINRIQLLLSHYAFNATITRCVYLI